MTLAWSVERADGIAAYEIQMVDHKTEITTPMSATAPPFEFSPTSCDADYTWTVTSIDAAGGRGEPSKPDVFYMPPPVGLVGPG